MLLLQDDRGVYYTPYQFAATIVAPHERAAVVRLVHAAAESAGAVVIPQAADARVKLISIEPVAEPLRGRLHAATQDNSWLKTGGVDFEDGLLVEWDYEFHPLRFLDLGALAAFFRNGNWGTRTAAVWEDLMFVQQVDGGDEWATYKITDDEIEQFESVSLAGYIAEGRFDGLLQRMHEATLEQCCTLDY